MKRWQTSEGNIKLTGAPDTPQMSFGRVRFSPLSQSILFYPGQLNKTMLKHSYWLY